MSDLLVNESAFSRERPEADGVQAVTRAFRLLRRHIVLFLCVFLCICLLGAGVVALLTPSYTAITSVAIANQDADPLAASGQQVADRLEDDVPATEAAKLESRDVVGAVVRQYPKLLVEPPHGLMFQLCTLGLNMACPKPATVPLNPEEQFQQQVDTALAKLTILPRPRSRIIDVSATAGTGYQAATLANALVANYQRLALAQQTTNIDRVAHWLDARTDQLRQRWLDALHRADNFNVSHNLDNTGDGTTANPLINSQIAEISSELGQAQARLAAALARSSALRDASGQGSGRAAIAMAQQPTLVAASNALMQLQATRAQQAAQFGSNYPGIKALDRQIASTQAALRSETGAALASIREDSVSAQAEVRQLTQRLDALRAQAGQQSPPQAEYRSLVQESQSARDVYQTFLEHSKAVVDRAALLQPPVVVVSSAVASRTPTFPNHMKLGLGIFVVALAIAAATVLVKNLFATGFEDADYLRAAVQLPLLGTIPLITRRRDQQIARYVLDEPSSRVSDAVHELALQLSLLSPKVDAPMAVVITSATPQEGKSTLAMWLALVVRPNGLRVLIIDSDRRRIAPGLHKVRNNHPGFTDLIAGTATPEEAIQTDAETRIDFISPGTTASYSRGSAGITRLRKLIDTLKLSYDMIIIDSPPLLSSSDVLALARVADQTVFVCRWQQTSRQAVMTSLDRLRTCGARISGVVVSMVSKGFEDNGYDDYNRRELALIKKFYGS
ncbi:AAA family ATPase [Lichenicola cladoniae]|uniref:non-specific protein-tyrosine kinase n=1 Tax=Lichenicola cladoniae TaxID=1484109 RepID=A0A6M8HR19_9PROT|nr:polysaccharide biosynthesis tyrosine autokinase [Lichenicola cladoniae]NPD69111.1 AAA family ATPase [Acetobacteraceae bacterium]QKE90933.1 AAA family ATPase [Lichenicola cladoniae]